MVPTADKTPITTISQMNDSIDTYNLCISSENRWNNLFATFTLLKSMWTRESLTWCNFYFKSFKNFPGYTAYYINCVMSLTYSGCLGDRCFGTQTLAPKKHFSFFFLGPRPTDDPIKSPLSVYLSVRQFGVFLRNGSLVFSDFWRDGK